MALNKDTFRILSIFYQMWATSGSYAPLAIWQSRHT